MTTPVVITGIQRKILEFIYLFLEDQGWAPSVREVMTGVGMASTSSVAYQLALLDRRGYLRRRPHQARALGLSELGYNTVESGAKV